MQAHRTDVRLSCASLCCAIRCVCGPGDAIFQFFTPSRLGEHRLWFASAFTLAVFTVFFFCIGEFPQFCLLNSPPLPDPGPCLRDANPRLLAFGPAQMTHWIAPGVRLSARSVDLGVGASQRTALPRMGPHACMHCPAALISPIQPASAPAC